MPQPRPLPHLPRALSEAGFDPPKYRYLYELAVDDRIPVKQAKTGRWTFDPADVPAIADRLGLRRKIGLAETVALIEESTTIAEVIEKMEARRTFPKPMKAKPVAPEGEAETVSYHLPIDLIQLYRDLAEERLKIDRMEKRQARRRGEKPPQARRSASALVREAMEAYRPAVEAELAGLQRARRN